MQFFFQSYDNTEKGITSNDVTPKSLQRGFYVNFLKMIKTFAERVILQIIDETQNIDNIAKLNPEKRWLLL